MSIRQEYFDSLWAGLRRLIFSAERDNMQQNLYEVTALVDTPDERGGTTTVIAVTPTSILAVNAQVARDKVVRMLTDEQAENALGVRIFVREYSSTYSNQSFR